MIRQRSNAIFTRLSLLFLGVNIVILSIFFFRLHLFSPVSSLQDFDNYRRLLSEMQTGNDPYQVSFMQTLGPPTVFLYYLPFLLFPVGTDRVVLTIAHVLFAYATVWIIVRKHLTQKRLPLWLGLSAIFLLSFPVRYSLLMGQSGTFLALCVAILLYGTGDIFKGIASGLLIIAKTIFVFPLGLLLLYRKRQLFVCAITIIVLCVLSLPWVSLSSYRSYFETKFQQVILPGGFPETNDYYNQSLRSTVYRIGLSAYYPHIFIIVLSGIVYMCFRTKDVRVAIIGTLLLSPVSWQHYYVVLFPIMLSTIRRKEDLLNAIIFLSLWGKDWPRFHTTILTPLTGLTISHFFMSGVFLLWVVLQDQKNRSSAQERT